MKLAHATWQPSGEGPWPTLFVLHGYGSNALDLLSLAPHLCGGRLMVVAPQGADQVSLGAPGSGAPIGHAWFPLGGTAPPNPLAVAGAVADARTFVEEAFTRLPADPARTAILGFSQGGVIAYALALAAPARWRGLAALSTWLPDEMAGALPPADRSALETLVQHGTRDEMIGVERARSSVERLRSLGVPVDAREYAMGHEVGARSLGDLSEWLGERLLRRETGARS
ncbi:MAG: alpha/beta hydrolase-fold protein [Deltaproteobacteria bacterium]